MKWTTQQDAAINTSGRSLIVSAAAGSGKTAVLVERLVRILQDREQQVRADSIIVVTFTNDAAAQMKRKLVHRLNEQITQCSKNQDNATLDWLLEQRTLLSHAKICTISSFCFDLIRENAERCGVSPQFTIAEEAQEAILRQKAMDVIMQKWSSRSEDLEDLYNACCIRSDSEIEEMIREIDDHLGAVPFPEQWLEQAAELCCDTDKITKLLYSRFTEGMQEVMQYLQQAHDYAYAVMLPDAAAKKPDKFKELWDDDNDVLQAHFHYVEQAGMDVLRQDPLKHVAEFKNFSTVRTNINPVNKQVFKSIRDNYRVMYKELVTQYLAPMAYIEEDQSLQKRIIPLLLEMTRDFRRELFAEKQRQNVLTFSDGEELALNLLTQRAADGSYIRSDLAETIAAQHSIIMVDEYQDSNNKQDCIFKLLSHGCVIEGKYMRYGTNAFLVGDLKQSIYCFRQANPENFHRVVQESVPLAACKSDEMGVIFLNQNFRSARGILNFVNSLFHTLMTENCGGVFYNENEQLNFGAEPYEQLPVQPKTTLLFPAPDKSVTEYADIQAEVIADTIRKMLDDKVIVIDADAPGGKRECAPKDFCILLRSVIKNGGAQIEEALRKRGIPVRSDLDTNLVERPEVHQIRNILQVLDNPMADTAFAAMLLSPVFGFTADDLAKLRIYGKRRRVYLQMQRIVNGSGKDQEPLPEELLPFRERCRKVLMLLEELRTDAERLPLEDCIQAIYDKTDLLSLQSLYDDAPQRRTFLEAFRQQAQSYRTHADLTSQSGLSGWLRYLDRIIETKKKIEVKLSEPESSFVQIKTIHKSKGLQFPFVFVAHLEAKFHLENDNVIRADEQGMLGMTLLRRATMTQGDNAAFTCLDADSITKQVSEELRLLYVALTRPQQQLFLVFPPVLHTRGKDDPASPLNAAPALAAAPELAAMLAGKATSMLDWLLYFLYATPTEKEHLRVIEEYLNGTRPEDGIPDPAESAIAAYRIWTRYEAPTEKDAEKAETEVNADPALIKAMRDQLGFRYTSPLTDVVAKHSVTELAHPDQAVVLQTDTPAFMRNRKADVLTGAARGTAAHKMMQYMNFAAARADIAGELERLKREGYLNEAEAGALTIPVIRTFLDSDLYRRIEASPEVKKEKKFHVRIGELPLPPDARLAMQYANSAGVLIGTMDLLFREGDHWILVDYKTDTIINKQPLKSEAPLVEEYALQLGLYQMAGELVLGLPITEAYLYSFHLGRAVQVDLNAITYDR